MSTEKKNVTPMTMSSNTTYQDSDYYFIESKADYSLVSLDSLDTHNRNAFVQVMKGSQRPDNPFITHASGDVRKRKRTILDPEHDDDNTVITTNNSKRARLIYTRQPLLISRDATTPSPQSVDTLDSQVQEGSKFMASLPAEIFSDTRKHNLRVAVGVIFLDKKIDDFDFFVQEKYLSTGHHQSTVCFRVVLSTVEEELSQKGTAAYGLAGNWAFNTKAAWEEPYDELVQTVTDRIFPRLPIPGRVSVNSIVPSTIFSPALDDNLSTSDSSALSSVPSYFDRSFADKLTRRTPSQTPAITSSSAMETASSVESRPKWHSRQTYAETPIRITTSGPTEYHLSMIYEPMLAIIKFKLVDMIPSDIFHGWEKTLMQATNYLFKTNDAEGFECIVLQKSMPKATHVVQYCVLMARNLKQVYAGCETVDGMRGHWAFSWNAAWKVFYDDIVQAAR